MSSIYNRISGTALERIGALSDGLFAIAMTLIVLEIKVPTHEVIYTDQDLLRALSTLAPRLVTYLLSFLTLGIFYIGQQTQLSNLERGDRNLSWLHLAFLAFVAVMPFSTEVLAEFIVFRVALLIYWINVLLLGVLLFATWRYSYYAELIKSDTPIEVFHGVKRRIVVAQLLYALGATLCYFNTYWSIGFIVLVQLNYAFAPRIPFLHRLTT